MTSFTEFLRTLLWTFKNAFGQKAVNNERSNRSSRSTPFRGNHRRSWGVCSSDCGSNRNSWSSCARHRRSQGSLGSFRTWSYLQAVLQSFLSFRGKNLAAAIPLVAAATALLVFIPSAATPASAAISIPGYIYTPAALPSGTDSEDLFKSRLRYDCPTSALSIMDCRIFGELTGPAYTSILKVSDSALIGNEDVKAAPLVGFVYIYLTFDASKTSTPNLYNMLKAVPIYDDKTSGKIFFIADMKEMLFDDWADAEVATTLNVQSRPDTGTGFTLDDSPSDWGNELYEDSLFSKVTMPTSVVDGSDLNALTSELAATTALKAFSFDVHPTVTLIDPDFSTGKYAILTGSPNSPYQYKTSRQERSGAGFTDFANYYAATETCSSSGSYLKDDFPSSETSVNQPYKTAANTSTYKSPYDAVFVSYQKPKTPSAKRILDYSPVAFSSSYCFEKNTARYSAASSSETLAIASNLISTESLDQIDEDKNVAVPKANDVYDRPAFTSCVNINPLEFKWDWPCVFESLFNPAEGVLDSMNAKTQSLFEHTPFNYLPMIQDISNKVFVDGACSPWGLEIMGFNMTIWPCNEEFRGVFRPVTFWISTIFLATVVGSWVFRKFSPSLPGGNS